jgi:hypothetical protein
MTGVQEQFEVGASLPPLRKVMSLDEMTEFEACSAEMMNAKTLKPGIHTDREQARQAGFRSPVASGMMTVAYFNQLLRQAFGEAWTTTGHLSVALVGPLGSEDEAILGGVVKGRSEDGARLEIEVWCENQRGEKVAVGSADLSVGGSVA